MTSLLRRALCAAAFGCRLPSVVGAPHRVSEAARSGTILLPALPLLMHSPFLFGYAKPVPVNFNALDSPRRDTIWVAIAGPAMNLGLATLAALAFHMVMFPPDPSGRLDRRRSACRLRPGAVASA
jgi:Zn-dependent protease